MIRGKITIGRDLLTIVAVTKAKAAKVLATEIKAHFNTLLLEAPQYSGNYVANMRLSVGDRKTSPEAITPYVTHPKNPKAHGLSGPINIARAASNLDTFEDRFVKHALKFPVWNPQMLMYNNMRAAKYIEGMPEDRLRDDNRPEGYKAVASFQRRVKAIDVKIQVKVT